LNSTIQSTNLSSGSSEGRRHARGRRSFWVYTAIAITFILLETFGSGVPVQIRAFANDIVGPVLSLLERPVRAVQGGLERLAGASDIYVENQKLRAENDLFRQWKEAALQLSRENERLRLILKAPKREILPAATARVIGVGGGTFERSVLVSAGSGDNVEPNFPVEDENGLIGRVLHVGYLTSRILLITDLNSRIPVRLERTGALAIAEGQNEAFLRLRFLPKEAEVKVGDRILTSGHGGLFPPDMPVARVSEIDGEFIYLQPLGLLGTLDYVRIMAYRAIPDEEKLLLDGQEADG